MLFSIIGAAWFIVLCLANTCETKARSDGKTEVCLMFLAHLSRRLRGELIYIVYRSSRRPSVRPCAHFQT